MNISNRCLKYKYLELLCGSIILKFDFFKKVPHTWTHISMYEIDTSLRKFHIHVHAFQCMEFTVQKKYSHFLYILNETSVCNMGAIKFRSSPKNSLKSPVCATLI